MVPAVAVKVALLCPEDTFTLAGTASRLLLLLRVTVVVLVAAWLSVTVQVLEALLASVAGAHATEDTWAVGVGSEIVPEAEAGDTLTALPEPEEATIPLTVIGIVVVDGVAEI